MQSSYSSIRRRTVAALAALALFSASSPVLAQKDKVELGDLDRFLVKSLETLEVYLQDSKWTAIRNALGGARAVFIVPSIFKAGFIFGLEGGQAILLARHGDRWSEPVFMTISNQSFGLQIGAQNASMLIVVMADGAIQSIVDQNFGLGTSGSIALGGAGVGGGATAGGSTGVNLLHASNAEGFYAGGTFTNSVIKMNAGLNGMLYPDFDADLLRSMFEAPGSNPRTELLRAALTKATRDAWNLDDVVQ